MAGAAEEEYEMVQLEAAAVNPLPAPQGEAAPAAGEDGANDSDDDSLQGHGEADEAPAAAAAGDNGGDAGSGLLCRAPASEALARRRMMSHWFCNFSRSSSEVSAGPPPDARLACTMSFWVVRKLMTTSLSCHGDTASISITHGATPPSRSSSDWRRHQ